MRDKRFLVQLRRLSAQYELQQRTQRGDLARAKQAQADRDAAKLAAEENVEAVLADWRAHLGSGAVDPNAVGALGFLLGAREAEFAQTLESQRIAQSDAAEIVERLAITQTRAAHANARLKRLKRRIARRRDEGALALSEALVAYRSVRP